MHCLAMLATTICFIFAQINFPVKVFTGFAEWTALLEYLDLLQNFQLRNFPTMFVSLWSLFNNANKANYSMYRV